VAAPRKAKAKAEAAAALSPARMESARTTALRSHLAALQDDLAALRRESVQLRRCERATPMEPALAAAVRSAVARPRHGSGSTIGSVHWTADAFVRSLGTEAIVSKELLRRLRGGRAADAALFSHFVVALGNAPRPDALAAVLEVPIVELVGAAVWSGCAALHDHAQARASRREAVEHPTTACFHHTCEAAAT
jgi:hypothetical protein